MTNSHASLHFPTLVVSNLNKRARQKKFFNTGPVPEVHPVSTDYMTSWLLPPQSNTDIFAQGPDLNLKASSVQGGMGCCGRQGTLCSKRGEA